MALRERVVTGKKGTPHFLWITGTLEPYDPLHLCIWGQEDPHRPWQVSILAWGRWTGTLGLLQMAFPLVQCLGGPAK